MTLAWKPKIDIYTQKKKTNKTKQNKKTNKQTKKKNYYIQILFNSKLYNLLIEKHWDGTLDI